MSRRRVICGVSVAAAWLFILTVLPNWTLFFILLLASGICLIEFSRLLTAGKHPVATGTTGILGALWLTYCYAWPIGVASPLGAHTGSLLLAGLFFILLLRLLFAPNETKPIETGAASLLAFFYIPFMLGFFIRLAQWGATAAFEITNPGIMLAGYLAVVVKMSDIGGYFFGSLCGKHKMFPRISPAKSWEGLAGGFLFSVLASMAFVWAAHHFSDQNFLSGLRLMSLGQAACAGLLLAGVGVLGDLIESMFKRAVKIKDSSGIFPAMGGFLDTFDSLIFTPAALYAFLLFIR